MSAGVMGYKIKWHKLFQMNHQTFRTSLIANFQTQTQPIGGTQEKRDANCMRWLYRKESFTPLLYIP